MATDSPNWDLLALYRERYGVTSVPMEATSLEQTLRRRQARARTLQRRVSQLEQELKDTRRRLRVARDEVAASGKTASLFIDHIVDEIRREHDETWSPVAVLGFRLWVIRQTGLYGYRTRWRTPHVSAKCLNSVPGDDVPHSISTCGPPPCGIYATKDLPFLFAEAGVDGVDGYAIGVVGLSGKVIEHHLGYRAATASVGALAVSCDGWNLLTAERPTIDRLFEHPMETLRVEGSTGASSESAAERFLNRWKENQQWI